MAVNFMAWYSQKGLMPAELTKSDLAYPSQRVFENWWGLQFDLPFQIPRLTIIPPDAPDAWTLAVYVLTLTAALLFMVGRFTRVSGIMLAVGMLSLHLKNIYIIHSGDTLMRLMVIYLALGQSGAAYSLDRRIALARGASPEPVLISAWPQRLIAFQISLCYLITVWFKWMGTAWRNGTATWYPSQLHEFDRFPVPEFLERQPFIGITTFGTLLAELALAVVVWYKPWRKWVLLSGLALHAYIEYRFNIPFFAVTIVTGYIAYYEGHEVAGWVNRTIGRWKARRKPVLETAPADNVKS